MSLLVATERLSAQVDRRAWSTETQSCDSRTVVIKHRAVDRPRLRIQRFASGRESPATSLYFNRGIGET